MSFYFPAVRCVYFIIHQKYVCIYKESFDGSIQSAGFYVADFVICAKCVLRYVCSVCINTDYYSVYYICVLYVYNVYGYINLYSEPEN